MRTQAGGAGTSPRAGQEPLEARLAPQRVPGGIDSQPRGGEMPGDRQQILEAADRRVVLPDHHINASQVQHAIVALVRLLGDREERNPPLTLLDRLLFAAEAGKSDTWRRMQACIVWTLGDPP